MLQAEGGACPACGRRHARARAWTYEDPAAAGWHEDLRRLLAPALRELEGAPLAGPLELVLRVVLPRPRSLVWRSRPMPATWAPVKPDGDNVQGMVQDALQALACKVGDQQIVKWCGEKVYAAGPGHGDTRPRVELALSELDGRNGR